MKTILSLIFILLIISAKALAWPGTGVVGTNTTNPGALATLVTSTIPTSGSNLGTPTANYTLKFWWTCSVAATYELLLQNGSGVTQQTVILPCVANTLNQTDSGQITFAIQDGWKINITNVNSFTGTGQASVFYAKETLN
jgi:hypothetical protein